jgi:pyruvate/2-oxoglutarate dehydrogenase complex dihydrolipoamide dehydrogenase (E3) component
MISSMQATMSIDPGALFVAEVNGAGNCYIARTHRAPLNSVPRAQASGERQVFMKVLVREHDDPIPDFTMIGAPQPAKS